MIDSGVAGIFQVLSSCHYEIQLVSVFGSMMACDPCLRRSVYWQSTVCGMCTALEDDDRFHWSFLTPKWPKHGQWFLI